MEDAELVQDFCDGSMEAFNRLVERWQHRIHGVAYRYFASHDEAAEITQKTFIKVYKKLHTLEDYTLFSAWIYRITNNLCLDENKRVGRNRSTPLDSLQQHPVSLKDAADRSIQQKELGSILQQALQQLPPEQRMVIIMKEYEALKFREIAEILQVPESTVKSRMYYGLRSLKKIFNHWNIEMKHLL